MKNHEGYPDPTANEAINGVRREEKQRFLEKKHGLKRGQNIETYKYYQPDGKRKQPMQKRKKTYTVVELYPYCVLLEDKKGQKICPSYIKLREMMEGEDE